ncbi:MAG: hypothetical protein PQJ59_09665 [Spirochaetales bacterium]|nr:hypothetical protein [Spirochaetales bacterium]
MKFKILLFITVETVLGGLIYQIFLSRNMEQSLVAIERELDLLHEENEELLQKLDATNNELYHSFGLTHNLVLTNKKHAEDLASDIMKQGSSYYYSLRSYLSTKSQIDDLISKLIINSDTEELKETVENPLNREIEKERALTKLTQNPHDLEALHTLGRISYEEGDYHTAEKYQLHILELDPTDTEAYRVLYKTYFLKNQYEESAYYCRELLEHEVVPQTLTALARNEQLLDMPDSALSNLQLALSLENNYLPALILSAEINFVLHRYEEALNYYNRALDVEETRDLLIVKGDVLLRLQRKEESLDSWEKAMELNPLRTEADRLARLFLLEKLMNCAYGLEKDMKMSHYLTMAQDRGGSEKVHILYLRRLKDREKPSALLDGIEEFKDAFPQNQYEEELKTLKRWAKEQQK